MRGEPAEARAANESIKRLEREYLAARCPQQRAHVFAPNAEATAANAGDDFKPVRALRHAPFAQGGQVLDARHLVARCTVVFGQLRFDDDLGIRLAWGD